MLRRTALLAPLLMPACLWAQGAFTTELSAAFQYEGGKTEEPLVAVSGAPSPNFFFRGDAVARTLEVSATRYLREVPDDGATPYALLPFVARVSSATLRLAQAGSSRDSSGSSRGVSLAVESGFTGDQSSTSGGLAAEWYLLPETALRASFDLSRSRSTNTTTTVELPSGRGALNEYGIRTRTYELGLGVVQRFGPELAVSADGRFQDQSASRSDRTLFTGEGGFRSADFSQDAKVWGVEVSAQTLALGRRLLLAAAASYNSSSSDLDQTGPEPFHLDEPSRIDRRVRGDVSYFPLRALGLSAGIAYGSSTDAAGLTVSRPTSSGKSVTLQASARWFPAAKASVALSCARVEVTAVNPPNADTFVKLVTTTNRVEITGSVRF